MELEVLQSDKKLLKIALSGRLDANDVGQHAWKLMEYVNNAKTPVVLDFSGATFLSSLGIRMLLSVSNDLKSRGLQLKLENLRPELKKVITVSGLDGLF